MKSSLRNNRAKKTLRVAVQKPDAGISSVYAGVESGLRARYSAALAFFGRLLHQNGYVSGTDGNLSVRLNAEHLLMTPRGVGKGFMQPQDMVIVTLDGKKVAGRCEPSSEIAMHLTIYRMRQDVAAIVHAHPCIATGFACSGLDIADPVCCELLLTFGSIPLAPYATPGTDQLGRALEPFIPKHDAILLKNHGVVTYSASLEQAYLNMETVEHCAKTILISKLLGGYKSLSHEEAIRLQSVRLRKDAV